MSVETVNNDHQARKRNTTAASELSMLINSLNLGSDALIVEEYQQLLGEKEVGYITMQCNALHCVSLKLLALH